MNDEIKSSAHTSGVHHLLAHSYSFYLFLFLIGLVLDIFFPVKIFHGDGIMYVGFVFLFLASLLILWAQRTSRNLDKTNLTKDVFAQGPYRFTRSPTHIGLFLLIIGFGMVANTIFVIFFTIVSFLVTRFVFIKEEEIILEEHYGEPYKEYKKNVKF